MVNKSSTVGCFVERVPTLLEDVTMTRQAEGNTTIDFIPPQHWLEYITTYSRAVVPKRSVGEGSVKLSSGFVNNKSNSANS